MVLIYTTKYNTVIFYFFVVHISDNGLYTSDIFICNKASLKILCACIIENFFENSRDNLIWWKKVYQWQKYCEEIEKKLEREDMERGKNQSSLREHAVCKMSSAASELQVLVNQSWFRCP